MPENKNPSNGPNRSNPLAASAEMLSILEHSDRSVLVMDDQYRILWFNSLAGKTMARYFGEPIKPGYTYWDYVPRDTNKRFVRNFDQALKGKRVSIERRIDAVTDSELWIEGTFSPLLVEGGDIGGVIYSYLNISERKKEERELRLRENITRAIESNDSQGFVLVNEQNLVVGRNSASSILFKNGTGDRETIGKRITDIVNSQWVQRLEGGLKLARSGGTAVVEFEQTEGDRRIIEVRFCPANAKGEASMVSLWAFDITDKKDADQRVRISEENLRSVFNSSSQTFYLLDHELNILAFNEAASKIVEEQYGRKLKIGSNVAEITPEDRMPQFMAETQRAFKGHKVQVEKYFSNNGREYWFERHINPIVNKNGVVDRLALWSIDVTERKRAEEALRENEAKFRQLATIMPVGIYQTDIKGNTVYVNERLRELIPASVSEILSGEWTRCIHPEDAKKVKQSWRAAANARESYQMEYRLTHENGEVTFVLEQAIPLFSNNKEYAGHLGTIIDLTVQRANQQLQAQKELAEQSLRFRSDFLASMSHEIRTPLTAIIAMAELLLGSHLSQEQRQRVSNIFNASEDLRSIVNDVLQLAELEAGKVTLQETTIGIDELLETLKGRFSPEAQTKEIMLDVRNDSSVETTVSDKRRLTQILSNLVRNAIKFTDKGSVNMVVVRDNDELIFEIHDTGIGIPSSELPKLFKEFSKLEHITAQNMEGTGLGLSISRKLATLIGGTVGVRSKFGEGSVFWLRIPIKAALEVQSHPVKRSPAIKAASSQRKTEVLLVEDNLINQQAFKMMLRKLRCNVTVASNGDEALTAFGNQSFDLIFMDVQMPVMDGITASERMRSSGRAVPPIIGLSGNVLERGTDGILKVPMDDLLVKPVTSNDLKKVLDEWA